ncbi:MAG: beta strand repeat-containing protein, partial [Luteolibacter sp.]
MKPRVQKHNGLNRRSSNLIGLCSVTFSLLTSGHAADVNTTGGTTVLNIDNPQNRYLGNGILQISTDGVDGTISLGSASNTPVTEFAMTSGGLISIDSGVRLLNGGFARGVWTNNFADLTINSTGSLDMWDGNPVRVDALNGTGSILLGFAGGKDKELRVGVDGGSGTFSGNIAQAIGTTVLRLYKEGAGTQTFDGNLTTQIPRQYIINGGAIDLSSAVAHSMTSQFLGTGNLIKSGTGALTISSASGALLVQGTTSVTGGSLVFGSEISALANLVAATGTSFGLNFSGQATVSTLDLGGSGPLAAGIYDSTHVTYGSFFTGTGQLNVLNGVIPLSSGTWSSPTGGFWNASSRWTGGVIANGPGNTATIGAAAPITVTLDRNETIGNLVFQGANHTLNTSNFSLTLAGTVPSVTVANGTSSTINGGIAGTSGLAKEGAGTLTLANGNKAYTGGSAVNEGRLVLPNILTGSANYSVVGGAFLEFNTTGDTNANRILSGGTISGGGNLVKTGMGRILLGAGVARQNIALDSGALIDVQAGVLRSDFGNSSGMPAVSGWLNNKADLTVATGAFFDIWDSNTIVDGISGSGTINKGWNGTSSFTFGVDNGSGIFSGTISNASAAYGPNALAKTLNLIKNGTGTQTFSGSNTYTGTTTINDGTLFLTGATQATSAITSTGDGKLGLDIGSSVTAASTTVTFTGRTVLVTGTPTLPSYTLLTANSIIGTPTLAAPAPAGYTLSVVGNELRLVSSGDPYVAWAGSGVNFNDDANNDGVDNGLAWFLGAALPSTNANSLLPTSAQNTGALVMTFVCLDAASRGSAVFEVQYSNDLGQLDDWLGTPIPGVIGTSTAGVVDFVVTAGPPGKLNVVATIPAVEAAAGKVFGRI